MVATNNELFMPTPRHFRLMGVKIREEGIIDFVAKLSPWLAPMPTSVFVQRSAAVHLGTGEPLSWVIAIVIETLGITTTHTALGFWSWNQTHEKKDHSPFGLAVGLAVVYVAATLGLIAVLEAYTELSRFAPILFPFLSVVGAVNLAMRSHHNRKVKKEEEGEQKLQDRQWRMEDEDRQDRREAQRLKLQARYGSAVNFDRNSPSKPEIDSQIDGRIDSMNAAKLTKIEARRTQLVELLRQDPAMAKAELARRLGLGSVNTVKVDLKVLANEGRIEIDDSGSVIKVR